MFVNAPVAAKTPSLVKGVSLRLCTKIKAPPSVVNAAFLS